MNLAFLGALVVSLLGIVLAVVDQFSDTTNIELPIYLITLFFVLAFLSLGFLIGNKAVVNPS